MDITFCTLFFDIGRGEWSNFTLHSNTYMYWFKNLLSLDIKLYIETEEKFVDIIKENRKPYDPNFEKTIIKVMTIQDLEAYKKFNTKLEDLMFSEEFKKKAHHDVPEMTKPLYNVLMFNKLCTLRNAIKENPYNTEYFCWVDTGFIRDESWPKDNQIWPDLKALDLKPNKIRFFCINDNIVQGLTDKEFHCMSQVRFLKGTIFFLHKDCLDWLSYTFDQKVEYCLENKFIGSDEKIFDLCYLESPESFELVKCDWRQEFHLYAHKKLKEYYFDITWNTQDISKTEAYDFWYIGVEDSTTAVIHRADLNPVEHEEFLTFKNNSFSVRFKSFTSPHRVVIWPVDKDKQWLQRIEYPLHVLPVSH